MSEAIENSINDETRFGESKMLDITSLTEEEKNILITDIKKSSGTIQIWVHSHFGRRSWDSDTSDKEKYGHYAIDREELICKTGTSHMPIISFIESSVDFDPDKTAIKAHSEYYGRITKKPIYYVRTFEYSPTPSLDNSDRRNSFQFIHPEEDMENWDKVIQLFKNLGISQAIISGMFYYNSTWQSDEKKPITPASYRQISGCVGVTIAQLKERGIKTYLSKVTYPEVK